MVGDGRDSLVAMVTTRDQRVKGSSPGAVDWHPPLLTTTPHQREDVSALDRFNVHRCPTRRFLSGTGLEPVTKQATVRYLYHSATAATHSVTDLVILNYGQGTKTTPEPATYLLTSTPTRGHLSFDRFNMHCLPTRQVFSGTRLELMTRQPRIHYLDHEAIAVTLVPLKNRRVEEVDAR
ncbi:uncharacterized protein TNCV_4770691 [Trichonephila clavipes]|nr:uncharacterized protein TNCV_4770691 [Trichonephila clavipes]